MNTGLKWLAVDSLSAYVNSTLFLRQASRSSLRVNSDDRRVAAVSVRPFSIRGSSGGDNGVHKALVKTAAKGNMKRIFVVTLYSSTTKYDRLTVNDCSSKKSTDTRQHGQGEELQQDIHGQIRLSKFDHGLECMLAKQPGAKCRRLRNRVGRSSSKHLAVYTLQHGHSGS